jgi:hypothetical protein
VSAHTQPGVGVVSGSCSAAVGLAQQDDVLLPQTGDVAHEDENSQLDFIDAGRAAELVGQVVEQGAEALLATRIAR